MHFRRYYTLAFSTSMPSTRFTLRGVIFDMDGTLTVPNLDFVEMYRRCGVRRDQDILAAVESMDLLEKQKSLDIIDEMEEEGRRTLRLMPGAVELGRWLHHHGLPMALVTRNSNKTVQVFEERLWNPVGQKFSPTISRDSHLPPKPDPASLQHIAQEWAIPFESLVMVGDSPNNDVCCGKAAGVTTALVDIHGRYNQESNCGADIHVSNLWQLPSVLWSSYDILGELGVNSLTKHPAPAPQSAAALAAVSGDIGALLKQSDIYKADNTGNTPLIWASDAGQTHVVEALLNKLDAEDHVNTRGYLGATAVCRASRRGHVDILEMLLQSQANPNVPNDKLQYPLHFAAFQRHAKAVSVLLQHGANPLELDRKGRTPAQDTSDKSIQDTITSAMNHASKI